MSKLTSPRGKAKTRADSSKKRYGKMDKLSTTAEPPTMREIIHHLNFVENSLPTERLGFICLETAKTVTGIWLQVNNNLPILSVESLRTRLLNLAKDIKSLN